MNFKKIIHICKKADEKAGELFQSIYTEAVSLANEFHIEKEWSQSCGLQINWNSIYLKAVKQNWRRSVNLLFHAVAFADI